MGRASMKHEMHCRRPCSTGKHKGSLLETGNQGRGERSLMHVSLPCMYTSPPEQEQSYDPYVLVQ